MIFNSKGIVLTHALKQTTLQIGGLSRLAPLDLNCQGIFSFFLEFNLSIPQNTCFSYFILYLSFKLPIMLIMSVKTESSCLCFSLKY